MSRKKEGGNCGMRTNILRIPGLTERILARLRTLGYWKDGGPEVRRFSRDHELEDVYVHRWVKRGVTPTWPHLQTLAEALGVSIAWLLLGEASAYHPQGRARPVQARRRKPLSRKRRDERLCQPQNTLRAIWTTLWSAGSGIAPARVWGCA